jgi:hypothetical protein
VDYQLELDSFSTGGYLDRVIRESFIRVMTELSKLEDNLAIRQRFTPEAL